MGVPIPGGLYLPEAAGPQGTIGGNAGGLDPELVHDHDHGPAETE